MGTRDRMLDAAAHVMRTRGLARATTKEIAKESGFSEAALYKHFRDKTDLFLAVLQERVPGNLRAMLTDLPDRAGRGELRTALEEVAGVAIEFYAETFPMGASLFSEPALLAAHREALRDRGIGPQAIREALAAYLSAEQRAGALKPDVDPESAAALLLGACFQNAFLTHFTDTPNPTPTDLVRTLLDPLTT
ncbi:TetR/AcrR family transcriptional regulator [Saccharopolyspora oryzae]|uniref:TetR/AcrR family transcriptional regulator n=1 Tax=Saccharopolyspora oryzae TaxID=2997343 RepID=A0ABT4V8E0_9PSEU|nr:TetR/AcrR family transcriptional regulator [Saccharopolyspora oryzae]MDA3629664.1 TetR/AcrR family transcriptional regulator [Saccharopolyspora oryzae]